MAEAQKCEYVKDSGQSPGFAFHTFSLRENHWATFYTLRPPQTLPDHPEAEDVCWAGVKVFLWP